MQQNITRVKLTAEPWFRALSYSALILALFASISYFFNWKWTGFPGNTLWDWLSLLLLPVALTLTSFWFSLRPSWTQTHSIIACVAGIIFLILLIGGYLLNWTWTGFRGNTLWDWLHLLVLPVSFSVLSFQMNGSRQRVQEAEKKQAEVAHKKIGKR